MNVISSWAQAFAWLIVFALLFELLLFRDLFNLFRSNRVAKPPQPPPYKTFRFLDLPDEIRNLIYEYALIEPNGLQYIEKHHTYNRKQHRVGHLTIINSPSTGTPTTLTLDPTVTQASCSHALTPSASGSPRPTPSSVSVYQIRGSSRMVVDLPFPENPWLVADAVYHSLFERRRLHFCKLVANGNVKLEKLEEFFVRVVGQRNPEFDGRRFWGETPLPRNLVIFPMEKSFDEGFLERCLRGKRGLGRF